MPQTRTCSKPRCGKLIPLDDRFCPTHQRRQALNEAKRTLERKRDEPWRVLYDTVEWQRCKRAVRKRDGFCCRSCGKQGDPRKPGYALQVHHQAPLSTLWYRVKGEWLGFLALATNQDICITLCPECHKEEDRKLNDEQKEFRQQARQQQWAKPKPKRRRT